MSTLSQCIDILSGIPGDNPLLSVIKPIKFTSRSHLDHFFYETCTDRPEDKRGEGIVLRDPTAWYFKKDSFFKKEVIPC
jgi:hypothetical protein